MTYVKQKLIASQQLNLSINRQHHWVACLVLRQNGTWHLSLRLIYEGLIWGWTWTILALLASILRLFFFPPNELGPWYSYTQSYILHRNISLAKLWQRHNSGWANLGGYLAKFQIFTLSSRWCDISMNTQLSTHAAEEMSRICYCTYDRYFYF